jgi:putative ABC transport system permease protein
LFLFESIAQAWYSLRGHKLRSGLTMFGIVWGITSMIILVGMGRASQKLVYSEFRKIGEKMIVVWAGSSTTGLSGAKGGRPVRFTIDDAVAIKNHCPHVDLVSPHVRLGLREAKRENEIVHSDVFGIDQHAPSIRNMKVAGGRFIAQPDIDSARRICVLGARVKEELFGDQPAVGDFIRLGGIRLQVVGVLAEKGEQLSRPFRSLDDDQISIPYTTAQHLFTGSRYFYLLFLQPTSLYTDACARREVREILGLRHGFAPDDPDAVEIFGIADMIGRVKGITVGMQVFLGAASLITLLIGGVGVMNIMFVSINERIREIGIMKAIGARRRQIFLQFLIESVFVTFTAGLIGIALGCSICLVLGRLELPRLVAAPEIDPLVMAISFFTLTFVGVLSGMLPALKASSMEVVEALRHY